MNRSFSIFCILLFISLNVNCQQAGYLDCNDCNTEVTACTGNSACNTVYTNWETCVAAKTQCEYGVGVECVKECGPATTNAQFDDLLLCVKQNCDLMGDFNTNNDVDFAFLPWFLSFGSDFTDISYGVNCMNDCHDSAVWTTCNNDLDCQLNRTSYWNCVQKNVENLGNYVYGDFTTCDEEYWFEETNFGDVLDCYNDCFVPFLTQCSAHCQTEITACEANSACNTIYDGWNDCQTEKEECPKGSAAVRTECIEECGDFENEQFTDLGLCVFTNCNKYLEWGGYQSDAGQLCFILGDCSETVLNNANDIAEVANCAQDCEDNSGCWEDFDCQVRYRDLFGCWNTCLDPALTDMCDKLTCLYDCTNTTAGDNEKAINMYDCYFSDCVQVENECLAQYLQSAIIYIAALFLLMNLI